MSSWPLDLPTYLDIALIAVFGALVLLRGVVLTHLFQRQLFGAAQLPKTLGSITSNVAHVFCATDLNASMPVYFTNAGVHFYSPAWGAAEPRAAGQIPIADAVRASAAFPGGIPPKRMNIRNFRVKRTPIQQLHQWQQLVFRDVRQPPSVLYLADGGVWNNLGTDWFDRSTRQAVKGVLDWHPEAEQMLIVDASAPTAARSRLRWFWVPYYSELRVLLKVWLVSYSSTVNGRIQELLTRGIHANAPGSEIFIARMIDPVPGAVKLGGVAWRGNPQHWSGRWNLLSSCWSLCARWCVPRKQWVVRTGDRLNAWTSSVPTTFFSIPPEVAVQLLVHGYMSTSKAMTGSEDEAVVRFPGIDRFATILGLETVRPSWSSATILGSSSQLKPVSRVQELQLQLAGGVLEVLKEARNTTETVSGAAERQLAASRALRDVLDKERAKLGPLEGPFLTYPNPELRKAKAALDKGDLAGAVALFAEIFAKFAPSDESIACNDVASYAHALAASHDNRAVEVIHIAEHRLLATGREITAATRAALGWWSLANAYAHLDMPENVVRSAREGLACDSRVHRWYEHQKNDEHFRRIRNHAALIAFEQELMQQ